jgi:hypothetical protein
MNNFRLIRVPVKRVLEEESFFTHRAVIKEDHMQNFLDKIRGLTLPDRYNYSVMIIGKTRLQVSSLEYFLNTGWND